MNKYFAILCCLGWSAFVFGALGDHRDGVLANLRQNVNESVESLARSNVNPNKMSTHDQFMAVMQAVEEHNCYAVLQGLLSSKSH